jgi:hypothetical protein
MASTFLIGNLYRLWVEGAVAGTYASPNGQMDGVLSRTSTKFNTTSKDSAAATTGVVWDTEAVATLVGGITLSGEFLYPDVAGIQTIETNFNLGSPKNFQIRRNGLSGVSPGDVLWQALMNIDELTFDFKFKEKCSYALKLSLAAAPTVNTVL